MSPFLRFKGRVAALVPSVGVAASEILHWRIWGDFLFKHRQVRCKKKHILPPQAGSVSIAGQKSEKRKATTINAGGARVRGRKLPRISRARRIDDFLPKVYFQGKKIGDTPKRTSGIQAKKMGW